jgi:hypothetical protein
VLERGRLRGERSCSGWPWGAVSYESWLSFGRDLIERGLRAPALVIADGAPGIWKAVRECWPEAIEQRCPRFSWAFVASSRRPLGCHYLSFGGTNTTQTATAPRHPEDPTRF